MQVQRKLLFRCSGSFQIKVAHTAVRFWPFLIHSELGLSRDNLTTNTVALRILDWATSYFQTNMGILNGKTVLSWHFEWRKSFCGRGHLESLWAS